MCFGLFWLPPAPRVTHRKHVISLYHVKHWNTLDLGGTWLQHHAPLSEESRLFFVFVPFVRPRWAEHVRDLFWLRAREEKVVSGGDVQPAPLISCVDFVCISVTSEFLFGLSQQQKRKKKRKKKVSVWAGVQLETACESRLFGAPSQWTTLSKNVKQLAGYPYHTLKHTHTHTHTHICRQRGKHTRSTSSTQEIQWWLFFILMNFWTCSFPLRWWKMETEGVACQINWCVRRERGQNGVIKRKALPPSHTHTHRQQEKTERGGIWFLNLTFTEVISGAFTILHSTVQSCSASTGGFVLKNSVSALFFSLAPFN